MDITPSANHIRGIKPVLFHLGSIEISTYSVFMVIAITVGALIYFYETRKAQLVNEHSFLIVIGAFIGSTLGAKLLELLININYINSGNDLLVFLVSGRTVIGGLIGGTLGVWLTKRIVGIKAKRGNLFAPAVAMGIAIGRIGCFFNGCCYGTPTNLPWAVDFGDGIPRHPTQLYESMFMVLMFIFLKTGFKKRESSPGYLFAFLMIVYFTFRFLIEFIRVEKLAFWNLTYFQIISFLVLIYLLSNKKRAFIKQSAELWKTN